MLSPTRFRKPSLLWFWKRTWTLLWIFSGERDAPPCSSKLHGASLLDWVSREEAPNSSGGGAQEEGREARNKDSGARAQILMF